MYLAMFEVIGITNILVAVVVVLLVTYLSRNRNKEPPGPHGLPLIGYLPFIGRFPPRKYFELSKKYGPVVSVRMGPLNVIILNDYETIQEALVKQGDTFSGRPRNEFIYKMTLGYGIIFRNYDEDYKTQRKFSLTTLRGLGIGKRSMEAKIIEEIEYLCSEIESRKGKPFNCQSVLAASVSNVICNVILGSRYSYDDEDFKGMLRVVNQQFTDKVDAFCVNLLMLASWLRFIPPFKKAYNRMFDDIDYVVGILRRNLEDHKKTLDPKNPRDFIDEYLNQMQTTDDASFSEPQLFQIVRDLFVAGTETTSSALRWAVLVFAHQPDIQEKVHDEIKRVVGDGLPSMNMKDDMPYVNAFIHELLRHRTLAPLAVPHATVREVSFRGYTMPPKQMVLPNIWAVHHNPENFENPSEFKPERFIDEEGKFNKSSKVIPFSIGPRYCLGEQLARMEIFLFLITIVQHFEVRSDPSSPLPTIHESNLGIADVPKLFDVSFLPRE